MTLIGLLIVLLVACVVLYLARLIIAAMGLPAPIGTIIYVIICLIVLIYVMQRSGMMGALG